MSARAESWRLLKTSKVDGVLPIAGSKAWNENEECLARSLSILGDTGVLEVISAAVSLRPPVYCFPVADLESELPIGWSSKAQVLPQTSVTTAGVDDYQLATSNPKLRDCIMMKPGSTVGDVYEALRRDALSHAILSGDFVRAEGKDVGTAAKKRQLGRDAVLDECCAVLRIQTNRKAVWQQQQQLASKS
jgi:hypothetical protein